MTSRIEMDKDEYDHLIGLLQEARNEIVKLRKQVPKKSGKKKNRKVGNVRICCETCCYHSYETITTRNRHGMRDETILICERLLGSECGGRRGVYPHWKPDLTLTPDFFAEEEFHV